MTQWASERTTPLGQVFAFFTTVSPSSRSCVASIGPGAPVSGSAPDWVFGNAMTSRMLDALRYGAPPHAGFAFGIDRLAALLAGEENIREVIAFPKTQSGADPLTGAPGPIDATQLRELGLTVVKKAKT